MKNSLADLNNILFEQIERLNDDEIMDDGIKAEAERKRANAISGVAKQIIENARVQLDAFRYADEFRVKNEELPDVIRNRNRNRLALEDGRK